VTRSSAWIGACLQGEASERRARLRRDVLFESSGTSRWLASLTGFSGKDTREAREEEDRLGSQARVDAARRGTLSLSTTLVFAAASVLIVQLKAAG